MILSILMVGLPIWMKRDYYWSISVKFCWRHLSHRDCRLEILSVLLIKKMLRRDRDDRVASIGKEKEKPNKVKEARAKH